MPTAKRSSTGPATERTPQDVRLRREHNSRVLRGGGDGKRVSFSAASKRNNAGGCRRVLVSKKRLKWDVYLRAVLLRGRKSFSCYGDCGEDQTSCLHDKDCAGAKCTMPRQRQYMHWDFKKRKYCCKPRPAPHKQGVDFIDRVLMPGLERDMETLKENQLLPRAREHCEYQKTGQPRCDCKMYAGKLGERTRVYDKWVHRESPCPHCQHGASWHKLKPERGRTRKSKIEKDLKRYREYKKYVNTLKRKLEARR